MVLKEKWYVDLNDATYIVQICQKFATTNLQVPEAPFFLFQGSPGNPGLPGNDGLPCDTTLKYTTGSMLVRHSQSSVIPRCEPDEVLLWDGYSLLYLEGNEKSHHQDLGLL